MSSFKTMYGVDCAPSIFKDGIPNKTYCVGEGNPIIGRIYGIIVCGRKVPIEEISFCECCAKKLPPDRIYSGKIYDVNDYDIGKIINYNCDVYYTSKLLMYDFDERCLHYDGYRVTVNIVDPVNNDVWRPITKYRNRDLDAEKRGVLFMDVPSGAHYEISVGADPKYFNSEYMFKIESIKFGDGRVVTYASDVGREGYSNILHNYNEQGRATINSYHSLRKNTRFYYQRMTDHESSMDGMVPDHYNKSNQIFVKIGLYRPKPKVIYRRPQPKVIYRGPQPKGPQPKVIYRGQCRGGSGEVVYDCADPVGGGATFDAAGKSIKIDTIKLTIDYEKLPFKTTNISIQLVNTDSQATIKSVSKKICNLVQDKLRREQEDLDKRRREIEKRLKTTLSHEEQKNLMINF